jgi:hypothetical protein
VVASLMEVYGSPTVVRQKFAERFARTRPANLTANVILTNPVFSEQLDEFP